MAEFAEDFSNNQCLVPAAIWQGDAALIHRTDTDRAYTIHRGSVLWDWVLSKWGKMFFSTRWWGLKKLWLAATTNVHGVLHTLCVVDDEHVKKILNLSKVCPIYEDLEKMVPEWLQSSKAETPWMVHSVRCNTKLLEPWGHLDNVTMPDSLEVLVVEGDSFDMAHVLKWSEQADPNIRWRIEMCPLALTPSLAWVVVKPGTRDIVASAVFQMPQSSSFVFFHHIVVLPEWRCKGIATVLTRRAINDPSHMRTGIRTNTLRIMTDDNSPLEFWKRFDTNHPFTGNVTFAVPCEQHNWRGVKTTAPNPVDEDDDIR